MVGLKVLRDGEIAKLQDESEVQTGEKLLTISGVLRHGLDPRQARVDPS